jgi:biotin carboxylase
VYVFDVLEVTTVQGWSKSMADRPKTILCISSYFKGGRFIETCKKEGWTTYLLTVEKILDDPWPRHALDEVWALPSFDDERAFMNTVAYLARHHQIDRVAPLDDYDVERVARVREFLRVPGMGETTARYFRDKLAMRARAEFRGIPIPRFVHILNHERIAKFMSEVRPPWMFKPRGEASSLGIRKLHTPEEVWSTVHGLGDLQTNYLLEQMIPGDIYHVDTIVSEGETVLAVPSRYRRPLWDVTHGGGVFATAMLPRGAEETETLLELNREIVKQLGFVRGVMHTEFIKGPDGEFYFLETAARVGGAHIVEMVEVATGINLWEEWARIEMTQGEMPYTPRVPESYYAGLIISLARQEMPDTSAYADPEIAWRIDKKNHVGFIVKSESHERVIQLMNDYIPRIERDYLATLPAPDKPTH